MKAIYIDPSIQGYGWIEGDFDDFRAIQDALHVDCFTVVCSIEDIRSFVMTKACLRGRIISPNLQRIQNRWLVTC